MSDTMSSLITGGKKRKEMDGDMPKKTYEELEFENETLHREVGSLKEEIESLKALLLKAKEDESDDEISDDDTEEDLDPNDPWVIKFNELRAYRITHGDSKVSKMKASAHEKLGRWVDGQRTARRKGKLSQERINLLDSVDMFWGNAYQALLSWEEQFEELKKHQAVFGNCNIHVDATNPSSLAQWVARQRMEYKRFKKGQQSFLTLEQIGQLKNLGFKWKAPTKK